MVLDSGCPYYFDKLGRYLCTMKLMDESVNPKDTISGKPPFVILTVFANRKEEIPQPNKMGSILRIHRGDNRTFEAGFQLNCDSDIKGSWVLFDPSESYTPIAHKGQHYTFVEEDKERIKTIRKFAKKFLDDFDVTEASSIGKVKGDVDKFCQVLSRKKTEKGDQILIFEGEKFLKLEVGHDQYPHVGPGDIIRVRGMEAKGNRLIFNEYTSMMKLDPDFSAAKELRKRVEKQRKNKEINDKFQLYIPDKEKRVVSEVVDKKLRPIHLKELFTKDVDEIKGKKFKVSVNVLEIGPKDTKSWLVPAEGKTKK